VSPLCACSCTEKSTRKEYAVKKVSKASLKDKQAIEDLVREVKILTVLKGKPNIVEFFGSYEDEGNVYMVLECAP
jgi:serine/threonine protein kinase